jgi:hypothetical protein
VGTTTLIPAIGDHLKAVTVLAYAIADDTEIVNISRDT